MIATGWGSQILLHEVRAGLVEAGFTSDQVKNLPTVAQFQETVDRECAGAASTR